MSAQYTYVKCPDGEHNNMYMYSFHRFPKEYENHGDLILCLTSTYLLRDRGSIRLVEENEINKYPYFRIDLYESFDPDWIMYETHFGIYKFFLLEQSMIFDYFIKNWKILNEKMKDGVFKGAHMEAICRIEDDYFNLKKLALIERDEEIIREII